MDESEIIPINDYDSNLESETDSEISINDSGSIDSFSDNFDFDISDDENDDLSQARNFYEIDFNNPSAPPRRFAFTNTPEIHLDFDASSVKMQYYEALIDNNLIDLIVHETKIVMLNKLLGAAFLAGIPEVKMEANIKRRNACFYSSNYSSRHRQKTNK
ncbi:hypothetical protein TNCV_2391921 [Trichonephila clavipes]|nr:hypothetical protein TNCV_2391921 [Trichonephila clavipes]